MFCPRHKAVPLIGNSIVLFTILSCAVAPGWAQVSTAYSMPAVVNTPYATSREDGDATTADPRSSGSSFRAELTFFHYDYNESVPSPAKSQEIGWMPGVTFGVGFRDPSDRLRRNLMLEIAAGGTNYNGSLQDSQGRYLGPYLGVTHNRFVTAEGTLGLRRTKSGSPIDVAPYLGLGLRLWHRGLLGPYGYNEDYGWFYVPLGIAAELKVGRALTVGLDASIRPKVLGWINVSGLGGGSLFGWLGSKIGYRVQAPVTLRIGQAKSIEFRPWYEYSAIGRGDLADADGWVQGEEPDSKTSSYGGNLALLFSF